MRLTALLDRAASSTGCIGSGSVLSSPFGSLYLFPLGVFKGLIGCSSATMIRSNIFLDSANGHLACDRLSKTMLQTLFTCNYCKFFS